MRIQYDTDNTKSYQVVTRYRVYRVIPEAENVPCAEFDDFRSAAEYAESGPQTDQPHWRRCGDVGTHALYWSDDQNFGVFEVTYTHLYQNAE